MAKTYRYENRNCLNEFCFRAKYPHSETPENDKELLQLAQRRPLPTDLTQLKRSFYLNFKLPTIQPSPT